MLLKICTRLILGLEVVCVMCYVNLSENGLDYVLLESFVPVGFLMCSFKCTIMGACRSFHYNIISFRCSVLRGHIDQAETSGDVIMVPKRMIQTLHGPCSSNSCGVSDICITDALGSGKCVSANMVCDAPPNLLRFERDYEGRYLHARANYTCMNDLRPCRGNSTSVCQKGGVWSSMSLKCGRFRWHNPRVPFDKWLPCGQQRTILINVIGTPTNKRLRVILDTVKRVRILDIGNKWGLFGMKIHWKKESRKPFDLLKVSNMTLTLRDNVYELSVNGIWFSSIKEKNRFMKPGRLSIRNMKLEKVEINE